jgi:hypothetical protein
MAEQDRRISLAGRCSSTRSMPSCLRSRSRAKWWGSASPSPWLVDFTAAMNARPRPTCSTAETSRGSSVSCSMRRPTPIRRGAIRYSASSDWRWTSNADSNEAPSPEAIAAAWARRLELHGARLVHTRSEGCRWSDLLIWLMFGDCSCPLLSAVHPSAADPARTDGGPVRSGRGRHRRSGRSLLSRGRQHHRG